VDKLINYFAERQQQAAASAAFINFMKSGEQKRCEGRPSASEKI
jgi:hypothetical protein